ncbi:hypothetical protein PINS_up000881 [Pythium insidiosum]|nr:hypothetical protein PINS_up000881 [Pythium insidiosum]
MSRLKVPFFGDTTDPKRECADGYPKCLCSGPLACGPFIASTNGYAPLMHVIASTHFVSACYSMLVSNSTIAWGLAGVVLLMLMLLRNSLKVQEVTETGLKC